MSNIFTTFFNFTTVYNLKSFISLDRLNTVSPVSYPYTHLEKSELYAIITNSSLCMTLGFRVGSGKEDDVIRTEEMTVKTTVKVREEIFS